MKGLFLSLVLIFSSIVSECLSQDANNLPANKNAHMLALLKDQVDAYNQQDIKRLVSNITEDFKYFLLTSNELILESQGKVAFEKAMRSYYKVRSFKPTSKIESYTIDGNRISFREVVSHKGKNGNLVTSSALGIYEIKDNEIHRAWYFVD